MMKYICCSEEFYILESKLQCRLLFWAHLPKFLHKESLGGWSSMVGIEQSVDVWILTSIWAPVPSVLFCHRTMAPSWWSLGWPSHQQHKECSFLQWLGGAAQIISRQSVHHIVPLVPGGYNHLWEGHIHQHTAAPPPVISQNYITDFSSAILAKGNN